VRPLRGGAGRVGRGQLTLGKGVGVYIGRNRRAGRYALRDLLGT
jgi:hypothetical protein